MPTVQSERSAAQPTGSVNFNPLVHNIAQRIHQYADEVQSLQHVHDIFVPFMPAEVNESAKQDEGSRLAGSVTAVSVVTHHVHQSLAKRLNCLGRVPTPREALLPMVHQVADVPEANAVIDGTQLRAACPLRDCIQARLQLRHEITQNVVRFATFRSLFVFW